MDFQDIVKGKENEGKEKHIPVIEIIREHGEEKLDMVRVIVGKEVPHPNTVEHHIAWIELYGVKKDGQVVNIGKADIASVYASPNIGFRINDIDDFKAFCALEYCNVHGVWQNCIEVE
ncbi:MAG: desulfoferrodoxin family protein [Euryarchaeota archaeon]|nr:desulfoferrodoxin family protein [Euryarchaeota archaeon]